MKFYYWETRGESWIGGKTASTGWRSVGRTAGRPRASFGHGANDFMVCTSPELAWHAGVQYWYGYGKSSVQRELRVVERDEKTGIDRVVAQAWVGNGEESFNFPSK